MRCPEQTDHRDRRRTAAVCGRGPRASRGLGAHRHQSLHTEPWTLAPLRGRRHRAEDRGPHSLCALKLWFRLGTRSPLNHTGTLAFLKVKHPECQGLLRKSVTNVVPREELNRRWGGKPRPHHPAERSGLDSLRPLLRESLQLLPHGGGEGAFCVFCCYAQILQESGPSTRCPHWSISHIYKCFLRCFPIFRRWL